MSVVVPFLEDSCQLPPVMYGTGYLYLVEGENLIDLGNFSLADFAGESEHARIFRGTDEVASVVATTGSYRLQLTGDSYSIENLARLLNEETEEAANVTFINLRTVREIPLYHIRFVRDLPEDGTCNPGTLELDLWRTFLEPSFLYTFSQDEQTVHIFNFIAIPDITDHPDNPLGLITETRVS